MVVVVPAPCGAPAVIQASKACSCCEFKTGFGEGGITPPWVAVYTGLLDGADRFTAAMTPVKLSKAYPPAALEAEWQVAHFGIKTVAERLA